MVFRMFPDLLSLDLELDDRDHLVHLCCQFRRDRVILICFKNVRLEVFTRIVLIDMRCQRCQRTQVEAVAYLKHVEVVVAYVDTDHRGNARSVSACRSHPQDVMVAPLDIHAPVCHEIIHDDMGFRTSVEYISDYVEPVDSHVCDGFCKVDNELSGRVILDDGVYDLVIVFVSVRDIIREKKFVHDIR